MKVIVNPAWSFEEVVNASWDAYVGIGITSQGYRNSVLMVWGNIVGKTRALEEFNRVVNEYKSKKALAEAMRISPGTLRKIEKHFLSLPEPFSVAPIPLNMKLVLHEKLEIEEDREYEFKEVRGNNPVRSIKNIIDEYAVSFLNSEGGRIIWGITDQQHTIVGVSFTSVQKDDLRREVNNKISNIQPAVDPIAFRIHFHPIYDEHECIDDLYVVEVDIPKANSFQLYFTGSNDTYVRVDGIKQKLNGPAIQDWIVRRLSLLQQS